VHLRPDSLSRICARARQGSRGDPAERHRRSGAYALAVAVPPLPPHLLSLGRLPRPPSPSSFSAPCTILFQALVAHTNADALSCSSQIYSGEALASSLALPGRRAGGEWDTQALVDAARAQAADAGEDGAAAAAAIASALKGKTASRKKTPQVQRASRSLSSPTPSGSFLSSSPSSRLLLTLPLSRPQSRAPAAAR